MGLYGRDLQVLHEAAGRLPAALQAEGDYAAAALRQVFLRQGIVFVSRQAAVVHIGYLRMRREEFRHRLAVLTVPLHAHMEALQPQVQDKGVLGALDGAEIPHELGGAFGDEGPLLPELLRVGDAVVAVVRGAQTGIFVRVGHPVEPAAVHDGSAHRRAVAVHVLGGGMGHDVSSPLKGTAVDRGGEGIVDNQGNAVGMGASRKLLDVQHGEGRIGDGLAEHGLSIVLKSRVQFLLRGIRAHEGHVYAHPFHGDGDQVEGAAIDGAGGDDVVAAAAYIEKRIEISGLSAAGQHCRGAAFQLGDFGRHIVVGGILEPGVEIAAGL